MDATALPEPAPGNAALPRDARRRSLPAPSSRRHAGNSKAPKGQTLQEPASPEIISSLISSLSAISLPASEHFDDKTLRLSASRSTPTSPNALQTSFGSRGYLRRGSASPYHAGDRALEPEIEPFPESLQHRAFDDAAVPPVVPTSRRSSAQVSHPAPRSPVGSRFPMSDEPRRSVKLPRGLSYKGSRETIREKQHKPDQLNPGTPKTATAADAMDLLLSDSRHEQSAARVQQQHSNHAFNEYLLFPDRRRPKESLVSDGSRSRHASSDDAPPQPPTLVPGEIVPARTSSNQIGTEEQRSADNASLRASQSQPRRSADAPRSDVPQEQRPGSDANGLFGSKSKRRKDTPPDIVLDRQAAKPSTPVGSPTWGTSRSPRTVSGKENIPSTQAEVATRPDEESAPSPAIRQHRPRDASAHAKESSGTPLKARSVSPCGRPSQDGLKPSRSSALGRKSSRIRRRSQPADAKASPRHRRTFSNPLRRNSNSAPAVRPPQILVEDRPSTADSVEDAVDAYLCSPRLSQKIRHPGTGRVISYSEVGDSEGSAVFCCVGMGLTRYIMAFYDELALTLKLRLITLDRPGVGDSEPCSDGEGTPLGWPDDVHAVCQALKITKFSILAHSAGAIYALAIALRMPQQIRGRIHLLAPWIPPSQLSVIGSQQEFPPAGAVPTSQKILRALPTPIFKVANSSFMSATSASLTRSVPKSPRRKRKGGSSNNNSSSGVRETSSSAVTVKDLVAGPGEPRDSLMYPRPTANGGNDGTGEMMNMPSLHPNGPSSTTNHAANHAATSAATAAAAAAAAATTAEAERERQTTYDDRLAHAIWDLATTKANPAVDLLVCLERRQPIGFRYADISKAVVLHHGSRDTRVPVENVKWLGKRMRRCEVRVLEGEGHGLMASGAVMGAVLVEIAKEWDDWNGVVQMAKSRGTAAANPTMTMMGGGGGGGGVVGGGGAGGGAGGGRAELI